MPSPPSSSPIPDFPIPDFLPAPIQTITENLQQGNSGSDVTILQQFLISQNGGAADQALASAGATGYFGNLTRAALAEFQASAGINPALGNFGPITRAHLSAN
jgi:peptidoglycan hydrolase-like protein with peptidoglycan-binding domain